RLWSGIKICSPMSPHGLDLLFWSDDGGGGFVGVAGENNLWNVECAAGIGRPGGGLWGIGVERTPAEDFGMLPGTRFGVHQGAGDALELFGEAGVAVCFILSGNAQRENLDAFSVR